MKKLPIILNIISSLIFLSSVIIAYKNIRMTQRNIDNWKNLLESVKDFQPVTKNTHESKDINIPILPPKEKTIISANYVICNGRFEKYIELSTSTLLGYGHCQTNIMIPAQEAIQMLIDYQKLKYVPETQGAVKPAHLVK